MSWHADQSLLVRYRDGALSEVGCSSVEAHLLACEDCRAEVSRIPLSAGLDEAWDEIVSTISMPRPRWLERLLRRVGVSEPLAHLVGVTPSLQRPWMAGVVITVLLAVLVGHLAGSDAGGVFMIVAPLLPLAGVAVAFGPGVDPTHELMVAAPIRGFTVLMARAAAVLASTIPIMAVAAIVLPVAGWEAVAWLLPALALTAVTLAAGSWVVQWKAAVALCGLWVAPFAAYLVGLRPDPAVVEALTGAPGQIAMACLMAVAVTVALVRRDTFDLEVVR